MTGAPQQSTGGPAPAGGATGFAWRSGAAGALLVLITLLALAPTLGGGWLRDDRSHVVDNRALQSWNGLARIWSVTESATPLRPLADTSYWIERRLFGLSAPLLHVDNVLLHALAAVGLWLCLRRLGIPGAWVAAAVFALHPAQLETAARISERGAVLSAAFYWAAFLALLCWSGVGEAGGGAGRPWPLYVVGAAMFVAALLSQATAATLPVALAAVLWWKKGRLRRAEVLALAPLAAVGAVWGALGAWLARAAPAADPEAMALSFTQRLLAAGRAPWFEAGALVWPARVSPFHPQWTLDPAKPLEYAPLVALIVLPIGLWTLRRRAGLGPLTGVVFFVIALAPALGLLAPTFAHFARVADRSRYVASAGLIAPAVGLVAAGVVRRRRSPRRQGRADRLGATVAALVLLGLAATTCRRAGVFASDERLWRQALAENPAEWIVQRELGNILVREGQLAEGMQHLQEALKAHPESAGTLESLAVGLERQGRAGEAAEVYRRALLRDPANVAAHINLANLLAADGRQEEALVHCARAAEIRPGDPKILINLGNSLLRLGHAEQARARYEDAVRADPDSSEAHNAVGVALLAERRAGEALESFDKARRLAPGDGVVWFNAGLALDSLGRRDEAMAAWRQALTRAPETSGARERLAVALFQQRDFEGARRLVQEGRRYGFTPAPGLVEALSRAAPEPAPASKR